ncbi:unnamed protein product [marine sediment metagenome]|uniref:Uncharacterized protein n=1 Tax=marine sediment metagenome TaxID=412755 RepID=X1C0Y7_9ZZZZ
MRLPLSLPILLMVCAALPSVANGQTAPNLASSVSRTIDGVTFTWSFDCDGNPCQVGQFLDGARWVRHPSGGTVNITSVTPDDADSGLEKNPVTGDKALTRQQGLLACAGTEAPYSANLDLSNQFPLAAPADDGVYVKVQKFTGGSCSYTVAADSCCVNTYATLTVLKDLPPDGQLGSETFRL